MCVQIVSVILGLIYLRLEYNQKGVMNINGGIFLMITNASFTNMFAVINVSALQGTGEAMEMWWRRGGQHDCVKKGQSLIAYSLPFFFNAFSSAEWLEVPNYR